MSAAAAPADSSSPPPSGSSSSQEEKAAAARNKRKYRADPSSAGEPGPSGLELPRTTAADYVGLEFMSDKNAAVASSSASASAAGGGEDVNLDLLRNLCGDTCSIFPGRTGEELSKSLKYMSWSGLNELQLEEVLLKSLDATFDNAVSLITGMGYSEAAARAAVVRAASQYSWKESLDGLGEAAVDLLLKTEGDVMLREGASVDDMRKVECVVLRSLVAVVTEAQPSYSNGDAMFCLLMSDMDVARASTMDYARAPLPGSGTQVIAQPVMQPGASSDAVASPNHSEGQPFVAAAKDDKPFTSKRGSSKKDSLHRQKFTSLDKSSRAMGSSKGPLRSVKHTSSGSAALDRKGRLVPDSSSSSLKGSSKVGKGFSAVMTAAGEPVDPSFTAPVSSTLSSGTNRASSSSPLPATSTDLSLALSSSSAIPVQSLDKDSSVEAKGSSSKINFSYDEYQKASVPRDRKDELILMLLQRQKELKAEMQGWTDWAQDKVMQVASRLKEDKEELQSLRKKKEESKRLQEERHTLEVSTRKKVLEMESAISKANAQLVKADTSARRRQAENAQLRIQLQAAKGHAAESSTKFEELSKKDEKTLKRSQHWESERAALQDELATEKSKLSRVLQQVQHAKEKKDQLQARSKQEEAAKIEAIARVASEKKEREQIEMALRSEENSLHLKAENEMQKYKSEVRALEKQIAQLKVSLDSANAAPKWGTDNKSYALRLSEGRKSSNAPVLAQQGFNTDDIQRDWECVMCLSEEKSVVFLPCAHQVLCGKCNDLHEKQGMKDCPSCRTPIQRRVCARFADS